MRSAYDSGNSFRADDYATADRMRPQSQGGDRLQLVIALLGLVSLGFMLWTIAGLLHLIPG